MVSNAVPSDSSPPTFESASSTRLGPYDLIVDSLVGAGLLAGLVYADIVPVLPWGLVGAALLVGFLVLRNEALGMLLQALAYGFFFAEVWTKEPRWMVMLAATIGGILVLDFRRFVRVVLPSFFAGISGRQQPDRATEAD